MPKTPTIIHIGSGKSFREDAINIDINPQWDPDIVLDMGLPVFEHDSPAFVTSRFGDIELQKGAFDRVVAHEVLEHVPALTTFVKNALDFLQVGGIFDITVPYDLSLGAWQDPTHVRAFNENSWLYYTDWFWYLGWSDARFVTEKLDFRLSTFGVSLKDRGIALDEILRTPRAVDGMHVWLKKILLTSEDKKTLEHFVEKEQKNTVPRFCVWQVAPDGYVHSAGTDEVALALAAGMRSLEYACKIVHSYAELWGRPIILCANVMHDVISREQMERLPRDTIIFNLEVIQRDSPWMTESYLALLREFEVWDYSRQNIANLSAMGILNVRYCGIGYEAELSRIQLLDEAEKDIDVLFYGSINARRQHVIDELRQTGLNVVTLFGVYGDERDACIARAKIVLCVHFYEAKVFEIVRASYLLANSVFAIFESGSDTETERPFQDGLVFCPYDNLVETCSRYVADVNARKRIAQTGFDSIRTLKQSEFLRAVLSAKRS